MKFSIVVPSYNQDRFINETFENLSTLKARANEMGIGIEILLFDNESNQSVQNIIESFRDIFDVIRIAPDRGQYDAINQGIKLLTGDYWTWLNTDDKIDVDGFLKLAGILSEQKNIDYIYGNIEIIDENSKTQKIVKSKDLRLHDLTNNDPGIFQPGSFFRKQFTDRIGLLSEYRCCFDYEYILRIISNNGVLYKCDFTVAQFRFYEDSKSGSIVPVFIREQIQISKKYGRKIFSRLTLISMLRLIKRKFIG